jgi:hypothetical protein
VSDGGHGAGVAHLVDSAQDRHHPRIDQPQPGEQSDDLLAGPQHELGRQLLVDPDGLTGGRGPGGTVPVIGQIGEVRDCDVAAGGSDSRNAATTPAGSSSLRKKCNTAMNSTFDAGRHTDTQRHFLVGDQLG